MPEKYTGPKEPGTACREKRGTDAGYARHRHWADEVCEECRKAHNRVTLDRYNKSGRKARAPKTVSVDTELFAYLWLHASEKAKEVVKPGIRTRYFLKEFCNQ